MVWFAIGGAVACGDVGAVVRRLGLWLMVCGVWWMGCVDGYRWNDVDSLGRGRPRRSWVVDLWLVIVILGRVAEVMLWEGGGC